MEKYNTGINQNSILKSPQKKNMPTSSDSQYGSFLVRSNYGSSMRRNNLNKRSVTKSRSSLEKCYLQVFESVGTFNEGSVIQPPVGRFNESSVIQSPVGRFNESSVIQPPVGRFNESSVIQPPVGRFNESSVIQPPVEVVGSYGVVDACDKSSSIPSELLPEGMDIEKNCDMSVPSQYGNRRITASRSATNLTHQNKVHDKFHRTGRISSLHKLVSVGKWKPPATTSTLNKNKWKSKHTGVPKTDVQNTDNDLSLFNSNSSVYVVDTERFTPVKVGVKNLELTGEKYVHSPHPSSESDVVPVNTEVVCVNSDVKNTCSHSSNHIPKPYFKNNFFDILNNQIINIVKETAMHLPDETFGDHVTRNLQELDMNVDSHVAKNHKISVTPKKKTVSEKTIANVCSMSSVEDAQDFTETTSTTDCDNIKSRPKKETLKKKLPKKFKSLKKTPDRVNERMSKTNEVEHFSRRKPLKTPHLSKIVKNKKKTKQFSPVLLEAAFHQIKKGKDTVDNSVSLKTSQKTKKMAIQPIKNRKQTTKDRFTSLKTMQTTHKTTVQQTKKGNHEENIISLKSTQKSTTFTKKSKMSLIDNELPDQSSLVSSFKYQSDGIHHQIAISNNFNTFPAKSRKAQISKRKTRKQTLKTSSTSSDYPSSTVEHRIKKRKYRRRVRKSQPVILDDSDSESIPLSDLITKLHASNISFDQDDVPMNCSSSTVQLESKVTNVPRSSDHLLDTSFDSKTSLESKLDVPISKSIDHLLKVASDSEKSSESKLDVTDSNNHFSDSTSDAGRCLELNNDIPNRDLVKAGLLRKQEFVNRSNLDQFPLAALSRLDNDTCMSLDESDKDCDIYSLSSGSSLHGVDFSMFDNDAVKYFDMDSTTLSDSEPTDPESETISQPESLSIDHFKTVANENSFFKTPSSVHDCVPNENSFCKTLSSVHDCVPNENSFCKTLSSVHDCVPNENSFCKTLSLVHDCVPNEHSFCKTPSLVHECVPNEHSSCKTLSSVHDCVPNEHSFCKTLSSVHDCVPNENSFCKTLSSVHDCVPNEHSFCKTLSSVHDCVPSNGSHLDTSEAKDSLEDMQDKCDGKDVKDVTDVATVFHINKNSPSTCDDLIHDANALHSSTEEFDTSNASSVLVQMHQFMDEVLDLKRKQETISDIDPMDNYFIGDCVHVKYNDRHLRMNATPIHENLHRDTNGSEGSGNYLSVTAHCESVIRKEVAPYNSFKDVPENEMENKSITEDKNISESLDENLNREDSPSSSSCQSASESSTNVRSPMSSCDKSDKTISAKQSAFDSSSSHQEHDNKSEHTFKSSLHNANLCLDDHNNVANTFEETNSENITHKYLISDVCENYSDAACDVEYLGNTITCSLGSVHQQGCEAPVDAELKSSVDRVYKEMLSSCHYGGIESAESEAGESDITYKKGLEDMLDNLRDVEAWTSVSNISQTDSSRNMDSLSDVVLDELVVDDDGIGCMVTIPTPGLKNNSHQDDLYLIQEALGCLVPSMLNLEIDRDRGNMSPTTNKTPTEPKYSVCSSPSRECQEDIDVENKHAITSQSTAESDAGLTLLSKKIAQLSIPEVKVVLERLELKNMIQIGDLQLNKISGIKSHSWNVRELPVCQIGGIESPCKVSTGNNTGSSPVNSVLMEQKVGSQESIFQIGENNSGNKKEKICCKKLIWNDKKISDSGEMSLSDKNIECEFSIISAHKTQEDLLDDTDFGKAITASKSKTKKLKRTKVVRQNSPENETDKSQGSQKSISKAALPSDTQNKPKSKLVQKILRQREREEALMRKSSPSYPSLEISPFQDIISSNFLKSSDTNLFGFPPKVNFGKSFRKTDHGRFSDADSERHRSPLDLCVATNENITFKTVKEPMLSQFKSPTNCPSFVFGDTSIMKDVSHGTHSFLEISVDTDYSPDSPESPMKDSTVKSELLSRLESVLNSSSSSIMSSPSSPKSSTPLVKRRMQQVVMFSPIIRSSLNSTKEIEIPIAQGPASKSILKNSTSNILSELKSGCSPVVKMRPSNRQRYLEMQDSPCSESISSSDGFENRSHTSDDGLLSEDFIQRVNSSDKDSIGMIQFDKNTIEFTNTAERQLNISEITVAPQENFNEIQLLTNNDNILMTYKYGVQSDVSDHQHKEVQSSSIGSEAKKEKILLTLEKTSQDIRYKNDHISEDNVVPKNRASYIDDEYICSGDDLISEHSVESQNVTSHMDGEPICSGDFIELKNNSSKMDRKSFNTENINTKNLWNEDNVKIDGDSKLRDAITNSRDNSIVIEKTVDDCSVCTYNSLSTLLLTDLPSIMICDDDTRSPTHYSDSHREKTCEEISAEYLEGYSSICEKTHEEICAEYLEGYTSICEKTCDGTSAEYLEGYSSICEKTCDGTSAEYLEGYSSICEKTCDGTSAEYLEGYSSICEKTCDGTSAEYLEGYSSICEKTHEEISAEYLEGYSSICEKTHEEISAEYLEGYSSLCEKTYDGTSGEYLEGYASQVEGSLLSLSSVCDNVSNNSESGINNMVDFGGYMRNDVVESDKIVVAEDAHISREDSDNNEQLLMVESGLDSSADESGLESDDESSSSFDDSAHKTTQENNNDENEKLDDDDDDALSLLAPSDASFLSDFAEESQDSSKCKKASVEIVEDKIVEDKLPTSLKSGVVKLEKATVSTQVKSECKIADGVICGSEKIGQGSTEHKTPIDKPLVNTNTLQQQGVKSLETLRGMIKQKNLFGCLDVVKQMENNSRMSSVQTELPSDVLIGILDVSTEYGFIPGVFYIMQQLYSKPHVLTAKICNIVLRMCHPLRRECLSELLEMFDNLSSLSIMPDIDCLVSLIRTFIESENWTKVWQVLKYACHSKVFTIPIRVQEMACQTCLNNPDEYAMCGINWLRDMLREQHVEYLQDVNHNILVDMAEICINLNEREIALELKSAVSHISSITIDFEDEVEMVSTYSDDFKIFASRIKSCSVTKNWPYLAQTFIDVCGSTSSSKRQFYQVYCDVFLDGKNTQEIVYSFTEFLRDVINKFERDCHDNPLLKLDYSTIGQIGRTLVFHCHEAKKFTHIYTILSKLLEFKIPCRSRNVAVDQQFLIIAMESCIHMQEYHRCVKILEGFKWNAEHMPDVKDLNRFLFLMMKLLNVFLGRSDCKSATKILSILLRQKQFSDTSVLSGPEFSHLENSLICKAVNIGDMMSAINLYNLHTSAFYLPMLEIQTLRLLIVSCAETGHVDEAHNVFSQCKLSVYHKPNMMEMPRKLLLSNMLTPTEVLFLIEDFLQELYNYLCAQMIDGHMLSFNELNLCLHILMYGTQVIDDPYLSVFPQSIQAAQNMVLSIVRQDLEPPLAGSISVLGLIQINWNSLENYLHNLDQKRNQQGLHFTNPLYQTAQQLPTDPDHNQFYQRGFQHGGLNSQHVSGTIPLPNPRRGSRRRGSTRPSNSVPVPLASLTFENMPPWRPPLLQDRVLPPDRFDVDATGSCAPHVIGVPMSQITGRGTSLERLPIRSRRRRHRGRGRWSTQNKINKIQK